MTTPSLIASTCVVLMLGSSVAAAQASREDGIKAFLRGDYVQAAEILRPLAEDAQPPDHTAQFLMGMLYDGGFGGQGGPMRACIMYTGAAATPGPFTEPATVLVRMIREEIGRATELCDRSRWWMFGTPKFRGGRVTSFSLDGFAALAREEYATAADLLRPVAESDIITDPAAQFLMATMYQSGRGAPLDPLRACALYFRASIVDDSPFNMAAIRLMRGFLLVQGGEFFADCQVLGNLGLDNRFEPATFDLGPGHSIAWDLRGAVVTYHGKAKRTELGFRGRGTIFLPIQHTALQTRGPAPRHFMEFAVWMPANGNRWTLNWHLFEVVRSDLIRCADAVPLLSADVRPSASRSVDLSTLVRLRVNEAGVVEWALTSDSQRVPGSVDQGACR